MNGTIFTYVNRDLSWLSFNQRVLQEAANPAVPLYERIRFLAIFSANLDEFFRVRMSALLELDPLRTSENDEAEPGLLPEVQMIVNRCQNEFGRLLQEQLLPALQQNGIHLYYGEPLLPEHKVTISEYFHSRVLTFLQPLRPETGKPLTFSDNALFLAVSMAGLPNQQPYGLVNIPHENLPRFLTIPGADGQYHLLFLDDIIRQHLGAVFPGRTVTGCYSVKVNRNADVSIADEFAGEMDENIAWMLDQRQAGHTIRFLYDAAMPDDLLEWLTAGFSIPPTALFAGGRYHNLSSLAGLPNPVGATLHYPPQSPLPITALQGESSIFDCLDQQDYLVHPPYQSYNPVLRFFNEAAIDPDVQAIFVTLYRIASDSFIANALISAARNGKQVTVFVELKARFDEENNLRWSKRLKAAGVRLVYSIPALKVHAKTALVKRQRGWQNQRYGLLATGNFNESTARFYTDHVLMTSHVGMTQDLDLLFAYLQSRDQPASYRFIRFEHLLVSQFNLMPRFLALIDREIANRRAGLPAQITIKLNNLQEKTMIDKLYEASQAGVSINLLVRAICTLIPGVPGQSETIRVRRIVDRYLEHGRIFVFHNNGQPETYLGSADWMNRNLYRRIEVCFPVYDPVLRHQISVLLEASLADNTQATELLASQQWKPVDSQGQLIRSQQAIYTYLKS
ncbi:polyphosphate kinase 1 [Spirosoma sp. SC4-14]|uniref:polyphosphate kinase 1 n=1 Tax=Spirosoma sp. SC4-14 TaxID=3128900 RepID=UPI0030D614A3